MIQKKKKQAKTQATCTYQLLSVLTNSTIYIVKSFRLQTNKKGRIYDRSTRERKTRSECSTMTVRAKNEYSHTVCVRLFCFVQSRKR